jgi:hypothetical protein
MRDSDDKTRVNGFHRMAQKIAPTLKGAFKMNRSKNRASKPKIQMKKQQYQVMQAK